MIKVTYSTKRYEDEWGCRPSRELCGDWAFYFGDAKRKEWAPAPMKYADAKRWAWARAVREGFVNIEVAP